MGTTEIQKTKKKGGHLIQLGMPLGLQINGQVQLENRLYGAAGELDGRLGVCRLGMNAPFSIGGVILSRLLGTIAM